MSPVHRRHGKINKSLNAFIGGKRREQNIKVIAAIFKMTASLAEEMEQRGLRKELGGSTLVEIFLNKLRATGLARMEVLIMRSVLQEVCGPRLLEAYGTAQRSAIVDVILEIYADGIELCNWREWPGRDAYEVAIARNVLDELPSGQLNQMQRHLEKFMDGRIAVAEALGKDILREPVTRTEDPDIERYHKELRREIAGLDKEQRTLLESRLGAKRYEAAAEVIAPAIV